MNKQIKQSILSGLVFSGTVVISFIGFATYTNIATQNDGDIITKDIWNNVINTINDIGNKTDNLEIKTNGIYNSGGNIGIGINNPSAKLEVDGTIKSINSLYNAARPICYSAFSSGNVNKALIMIPLNNNNDDLDARCHAEIGAAWHAGGIAKPNSHGQNCNRDLDNIAYGGGYTSYVEESYFESSRAQFPDCNSTNAVICCSGSFPN